jgi:hypothetical protein
VPLWRLRTVPETKTPAEFLGRTGRRQVVMNQKTDRHIAPLAGNGKTSVALHFHRNGTLSFKDAEGKWTRYLAEVPPHLINKLDRRTRLRLWVRDFKVERAWAEANA